MKKALLNGYRWIFARRALAGFNRTLFQLGLRGLGVQNYENTRVSGDQHLIHKILPRYVTSDRPTFFDVGANVGDYCLMLRRRFPGALIHAFEPHPENCARLKERLSSDHVKIHNIAIGNQSGKAALYDRADLKASSHASLHREVISGIHRQGIRSVEVTVETLDAFTEREGIRHIDFLKIDTEGNELAVLQGASSLLQEGRVGCIHFEFNEMNVISRVFFRDFREMLKGYELYRILPDGLLPLGDSPLETELFGFQNIFACKEPV